MGSFLLTFIHFIISRIFSVVPSIPHFFFGLLSCYFIFPFCFTLLFPSFFPPYFYPTSIFLVYVFQFYISSIPHFSLAFPPVTSFFTSASHYSSQFPFYFLPSFFPHYFYPTSIFLEYAFQFYISNILHFFLAFPPVISFSLLLHITLYIFFVYFHLSFSIPTTLKLRTCGTGERPIEKHGGGTCPAMV